MIKKNLFGNKNKENKILAIGLGVSVGAVGGALIGSHYSLKQAKKELQNIPLQTVTVTYKEPVYEEKELAKIPRDQYLKELNNIDYSLVKPVYAKVPQLDENGNVVYREVTKTFVGRGEPIVRKYINEVRKPEFKGYDFKYKVDKEMKCTTHIYYLPHYDPVNESTHLRPYIHKECKEEIKGYWVRFTPKIDYKILDTYEGREVIFENKIDVKEKMLKGAIIGALIGGIVGGVIGAVLHNLVT